GVLGLAMLDIAWAHPGVDAYRAGEHAIRTVSRPFVLNRSLFVRPQTHSWRTRDSIPYPSGVAGLDG
ncbi:MAG: hypothetical protein KC656_35590, partial [Myxococcales bacterium]|nr:hypothetical protein [Myxococcales bacterium]